MSDTFKGFIMCFVVFLLWSFGCFLAGVLYQSRTNGKVDDRDSQYTEQQQQLTETITGAETQLYDNIGHLEQEIYISTRAVRNLQELLQEIRKQRIDI